jgi:hypothetical protein
MGAGTLLLLTGLHVAAAIVEGLPASGLMQPAVAGWGAAAKPCLLLPRAAAIAATAAAVPLLLPRAAAVAVA